MNEPDWHKATPT